MQCDTGFNKKAIIFSTLLMHAVRKHTDCKWLLLYVERWLTAPMELTNGEIQKRTKGTPQGGVISPLLANLFLHDTLDKWMEREFPENLFERYADDMIIHCKTLGEATSLKMKIEKRLSECHLKLHPLKTQSVYCKDSNRTKEYSAQQFDFLGFTFRPRMTKSAAGKFFVNFDLAISKKSANSIRDEMRKWKLQSQPKKSIEDIARWINPKLAGWSNYYGKYRKTALYPIYSLLNLKLAKWARGKYKKLRCHPTKSIHWLGRIANKNKNLFTHWRLGIRPAIGQ